jgi:hypothetical protein
VTEEIANDGDRRALLDKFHGVPVPQSVGVDAFLDPGSAGQPR